VRLLLDESLPRRLGLLLVGHDVVTVADAGWAGLTNGRLLGIAQHEFDCLLTADRSLVHQQSLPRFDIAVVVLRAKTNRLDDLAPLIPRVLELLPSLRSGQSAEIS
jgi:predicted nuclease of predicted toxin-antitoxin system